jgi:putative sterol carrier protein
MTKYAAARHTVGPRMTDATAAFFAMLADRAHDPLLEKANGTIRFELVDGKRTDRWFLTLDNGHVSVSRKNAKADCTVRAEKAVFDGIAGGKVNGLAAVLRGAMTIEGDMELMVLLQRVFPSPPARRAARRNGASRRRKA